MPRKKTVEKNKEKEKAKKTTKKKEKNAFTTIKFYPDGKKEEVVLEKSLFHVAVNPKTLALYIRVYLANKRQGTASTKTRGEVSGSTRKIYRQKGTGRARHGDIKAPIFVGGGIAFGPKPRDYSLKINKKQKRQAFLGALTYQFKNNGVLVFDDSFLTIKPKTNELFDFFVKNNLASEKKLIVLPKMEKNNLVLAGRNISNLKFTSLESLNAYQILNTKKLIFLEEALKSLAKKYGNQ
jgi:large subunit ribosomal protein L4